MLVPHEAVDGEARLVPDAQPALAEDVEALRLGGQQDLAQPLMPRLEARDLVDDDLPLHGDAQAVRARRPARSGSSRVKFQPFFTLSGKCRSEVRIMRIDNWERRKG